MENLEGKNVVVTGGSRGLGLGIVEALVEKKANVTIVARDKERLTDVSNRLGCEIICGDVTDKEIAHKVLQEVQPLVLILNAGETPVMTPIHKQSWESFNKVWDTDVKAGFHWIQEAINLPLPRGSRVIIVSSGAALNGSPLSGSYAGAKKMLWFIAHYANSVSKKLDLDILFQTIVPMQIIGETDLGHKASEAYAKQKGVSIETFLAGFGKPMSPRKVGDNVISILTNSRFDNEVALGMNGSMIDIISLDAKN